MGGWFRRLTPIKCKDAERALRALGFKESKKSGSSHRNFKRVVDGVMRKVTLDCHKGEVSSKNVKSMIAQSGTTANKFYEAAGLL